MVLDEILLFGLGGMLVEVDEVFIGCCKGVDVVKGGFWYKMKVVMMIDCVMGVVCFVNFNIFNVNYVVNVVCVNVVRIVIFVIDEVCYYCVVGWEFVVYEVMFYGNCEYVCGEFIINLVEGFFSIFKWGMCGIY